MKQTAVEYLEKQIDLGLSENGLKLEINRAKEMEKQQIMDACDYGKKYNETFDYSAEQYYNETFKSE